MATRRCMDWICLAAVLAALLIAFLFWNAETFGIQASSRALGYEDRLFDASQVHTVEIQMDDWEGFLETCENEEYAVCTLTIDGEIYRNVGIRAKGNSSLSSVSAMGSDRYSFKVEFDQYAEGQTYHGLDKLNLNNLIYDNTCMKDYLTYQLMNSFGVAAPLSSYVYITVNGEDWGLYAAVEGVEEAFLERNYGADYGELYKPDSMDFGGGRGNGQGFDMGDFSGLWGGEGSGLEDAQIPDLPEDFSAFGGEMSFPALGDVSLEDGFPEDLTDGAGSAQGAPSGGAQEAPSGGDGSGQETPSGGASFSPPDGEEGFGGLGSEDVKLQYIDDDPDSYANIFDSAKTDITKADKTRLIQSLKALSAGEDLETVLDMDAVLRYFVVHNFVCNGDSYTGTMVHNYYLYEEDGQLSMIPWDYNLAFGTFDARDATDSVNTPIDTPVSGGTGEDRPMLHWIFTDEAYTDLYHQYFAEFLTQTDFETLIRETAALIAPYVERDPTKFCTYEEFETGVDTLLDFCLLRAESIQGQLEGTIPSTSQGQSEDPDALVDASHLTLSDMGSMATGGMPGGGGPGGSFSLGGDEAAAGGDSFPAGGAGMSFGGFGGMPAQMGDAAPAEAGGAQPSEGTAPPEDPNGDRASAPEDSGTAGQDGSPAAPEGETGSGDSGQTPGGGASLPGGGGPGGGLNMTAAQDSSGTAALLGISLLVLLAGLAVAFRFRR